MTTDEIVIGGDATDIPPGTYPGKLKDIAIKESVAYGDFRAWDFTLDMGSVVGGATSMNTGSKSKGGRWIAAILGRKPEKGESVKALLIGKPCLVVVGLNKDDWPTVTDVLPPMAAAVVSPPAAATPSPETIVVPAGRAELP